MTAILAAAFTVAVVAAVLVGLVVASRRVRRAASSIAGPFEEIWHPAAHRSRVIVEVQDQRMLPPSDAVAPPLTIEGTNDPTT